jgi:hypothetical protein
VKVDAVREFGGQVEFVDVGVKSRAERVRDGRLGNQERLGDVIRCEATDHTQRQGCCL